MHRFIVITVFICTVSFAFLNNAKAFQVEYNTDFKVVHNTSSTWGESPGIKLELIREIGGLEIEGEWDDFYKTRDMEVDSEGNLYVLNDYCVRKYDKDGKFLALFGRKGQGPSEFQNPFYLDVDQSGNMYVEDWAQPQPKIIVLYPGGKELRRFELQKLKYTDTRFPNCYYGMDSNYHGINQQIMRLNSGRFVKFNMFPLAAPKMESPPLRPLCRIFDENGKFVKEFGQPRQYNDWLMNFTLNYFSTAMAKDENDNIYITYYNQNRVEKYNSEGKLLLRIDRPTEVKETTKRKAILDKNYRISGAKHVYERLKYNVISSGIAVGEKGRIWVITRTEKKIEDSVLNKFDIFNKDGIYLGSIPIETIRGIRKHQQIFAINKDRLYTVYNLTLYIYKIIELN